MESEGELEKEPLSTGCVNILGLIKPRSPALQVDSLPAEPPGKPKTTGEGNLSLFQQIFPTQELNQGLLHSRLRLCSRLKTYIHSHN